MSFRSFPSYRSSVSLNAKDFGAVPDNTTDVGIALQRAHDMLPAAGGSIKVDAGKYAAATGATFTKPVTMLGDGIEVTTIFKNFDGGALFAMNGSYQRLTGFSARAGVGQTAGAYVSYGASAVRQMLDHFYFDGWFQGILWNGQSSLYVDHGYLLTGASAAAIGCYIAGGVSADMKFGDILVDTTGTQPQAGFRFDVCGDATLTKVVIIHANSGLACLPGNGQVVASLSLSECQFDTCAARGLLLRPQAGTTGVVSRTRLADCWTASSGAGIVVDATAGIIDGLAIVDHHSFVNTLDGLRVVGAGNVKNVRTLGGEWGGNGRDGLRFEAGVTDFSVCNVRTGNTSAFAGNTGWGINVTAAGSQNYIITHNDTRGNTAGGINDLGVVPKIVGPNL